MILGFSPSTNRPAKANLSVKRRPGTKCRENQPTANAVRLLLLDATRYHNQIVKDQTDCGCSSNTCSSHLNRTAFGGPLARKLTGKRRSNLQAEIRPLVTRFSLSGPLRDSELEIKWETPNLALSTFLVKGPFLKIASGLRSRLCAGHTNVARIANPTATIASFKRRHEAGSWVTRARWRPLSTP